MRASLRALLAGIIDYAGLFPPAELPLEQSIRNHARYRQEPESWMLGRFVCPAARLAELAPLLTELASEGRPPTLSVVCKGGSTRREFLRNIKADLEAIRSFNQEACGRVLLDAYECRLPAELLAPDESGGLRLRACIHGPAEILTHEGQACASWYFEIVPASSLNTGLRTLIGVLAEDAARTRGLKLRCGGLEAVAFPGPGDVAFAMDACREPRTPMKFTAGLHHPLRHFDIALQTYMHGFLNVFGAGVLAHAQHLSLEQIREIIEDQDAGNFRFDDDGFRWKDWNATTEEIKFARQHAVVSFGSCSFDEPREDLRALGLL